MNLAIAGGLYHEYCIEPSWNQWYGSAGRAAASISGRSANLSVHCTLSERDIEHGRNLAADFRFTLEEHIIPFSVSFSYLYALGTPNIYPDLGTITAARFPFTVKAENVLRYGMLEASPKVTAKNVVYDPQSTYAPESFSENDSSAENLAIVLNRSEGRRLTSLEDPAKICEALHAKENANIVVLKDGSNGCFVSKKGQSLHRIPAYPTKNVFKIGSGDIFSANFAYAYLVDGADPVEAAKEACRAVAHYVSYRYLPTPRNIPDIESLLLPDLETLGEIRRDKKYHVYLAGPFFDLPQLWLIHEANAQLTSMGLRVFSPYHYVGVGAANVVAPKDVAAIQDSSLLLCCLDGLDSGTIFEIGYARALNIPCLYYTRREPPEPLKMIDGTKCLGFDDFSSALYATAWYSKHNE